MGIYTSRYFEFIMRPGRPMAHCAIMDTLDPTISCNSPALKRLAQALDVPSEEFLAEPRVNEVGDLLVFVRIWSEIKNVQDRDRVLEIARQEAKRVGYKGYV
ncbi:hypothetical protein MKK65_07980 [Methylobacterium sp. J-001]|uniref:hypothetical protein n=1 Tax=Methylobacterium sp. J-001 TaxID=2836609 RepID=UPI001FBAF939|nr:hypothetical protein [Methylobacterium sp. J-001]MCJ2116518.1 hypothetical protein [Methylobacterium sp. J-001]